MVHKHSLPGALPTRKKLLEFIKNNPGKANKRNIARAFQLNSVQKILLKKMLRAFKAEGLISTNVGRRLVPVDILPEITMVEVIDTDDKILVRPLSWEHGDTFPRIYIATNYHRSSKMDKGDQALVKLCKAIDGSYQAHVIRHLTRTPKKILGVYLERGRGGCVRPVKYKNAKEFSIAPKYRKGAKSGDLVVVHILPNRSRGLKPAKVVARLESKTGPRAASSIALYNHDIPVNFPSGAIKQVKQCKPVKLGRRTDLRNIPLITIDGSDAKDFDDAVWAEPDRSSSNPGGWHLLVAIADVAYYVQPGDAVCQAAYERGNSIYFPDRVIHMLPKILAANLCSLVPRKDRPCLAVHLWIDCNGNLLRYRFVRGLMRSVARLTYEQVQEAYNGQPDKVTAPLMESVITPLYGAYKSLKDNRVQRGALDLDLPEQRIILNKDNDTINVEQQVRLDSHQLIETFMICANVTAAKALEAKQQPCMYRIHDTPSYDKLENLRKFLKPLKLKLPKNRTIKSQHFNLILKQVNDKPYAHAIDEIILRSQAQAEYSPNNIGHFGLALRSYCHFTSPIRRYSDLLVHRALISSYHLGVGGLSKKPENFTEIGAHLSRMERRAVSAERDAADRYLATFMANKVGNTFTGWINGITRFGLFITLNPTGANGLIPMHNLPDDYYICDKQKHILRGHTTGQTYCLGEPVQIQLVKADPITGGLTLKFDTD